MFKFSCSVFYTDHTSTQIVGTLVNAKEIRENFIIYISQQQKNENHDPKQKETMYYQRETHHIRAFNLQRSSYPIQKMKKNKNETK